MTKLIVPYTLAALQKAGEKTANIMETTTETTDNTAETTDNTTETICKLIKGNPKITAKELDAACRITEDGVAYHIKKLKMQGRLVRVGGSRNGGEWKVQK